MRCGSVFQSSTSSESRSNRPKRPWDDRPSRDTRSSRNILRSKRFLRQRLRPDFRHRFRPEVPARISTAKIPNRKLRRMKAKGRNFLPPRSQKSHFHSLKWKQKNIFLITISIIRCEKKIVLSGFKSKYQKIVLLNLYSLIMENLTFFFNNDL